MIGVDGHYQSTVAMGEQLLTIAGRKGHTPFCVQIDGIDDTVIRALVDRANSMGCDAYLLPQDPELPMSNRRDDLLIIKP